MSYLNPFALDFHFIEHIIAFVEKKPNIEVTVDEVNSVCKNMASYKRPSHVELLDSGKMPLNRVAKTDYVTLKLKAASLVEKLREQDAWD